MFEVFTTMDSQIYNDYGYLMVESFLKHWPVEVSLHVYKQDAFDLPKDPRIVERSLTATATAEHAAFMERHRGRPDQQNPLELTLGACRFAYKSFVVFDHCMDSERRFREGGDVDYAIWLDADTVTFRDIPIDFLKSLTGFMPYVTYLGRENNYTECGFVIYCTAHSKNQRFMNEWRQLYVEDKIFELKEWHDSYIFDQLRKKFLNFHAEHNLTPWGKDYEHVFINSCLGAYIDHFKGPRKKEKHSRFSDLILDRATPEAVERYSKF
jgi:hypothetical protein